MQPEPGKALDLPIPPADRAPEDVRAELDAEARRLAATQASTAPRADMVPEDVLGERDLEARLAGEETFQRLAEGQPPAEDDPRS